MSSDPTEGVELLVGTSIYVSKSKDDTPRNAIKAGLSPCGQVYVGLVTHEDVVMPAKIVPAYNLCYYSYEGSEYSTPCKTYLTVDPGFTYKWITVDTIEVPNNAAIIKVADKEPYYFGRAVIDGEKCVGKIIKSSKVCLVPKTGREFTFKDYDILCIDKSKHIGM